MEKYKKEANAAFFRKIIKVTTEGGTYIYPARDQTYTVVGGILYGTKEGIEILKEITPKSFHATLKVMKEA